MGNNSQWTNSGGSRSTQNKTLAVGYRAASGGGTQLAAGHFVNQKFSMTAIFPRPDAETGTLGSTAYAKNRWAYYDGSNNIETAFAFKIFGGSRPLMYSISAQPSGESATIGNTYGDKFSHGVFKWTPTRAFTTGSPATFTVRVTGQDGNFIDITWTMATSSSTSQFIFIDPAGSSGNSGAIGSPKTLNAVTGGGGASTTTTFPGRHIIMRGGSYNTTAHTDAATFGTEPTKARLMLDSTHHPMVYSAYPGETPIIDFINSEIAYGYTNSADDFYIGGSGSTFTQILNASQYAFETHNFWGFSANRVNFQWLWIDGFIVRNNGLETNSTPIYTGTHAVRNYYGVHGCAERSRVNATVGGNDHAIHGYFCIDYIVTEYCDFNSRGYYGLMFKDTVQYITAAHNSLIFTNANADELQGKGICFSNQTLGNNAEACYNFILGNGITLNEHPYANCVNQFSYRNTLIRKDTNGNPGITSGAGTGPFTSESDVIICRGNGTITSGLTSVTGTECEMGWFPSYPPTNPPCNLSTGALQNISGGTQYRTLYLGTRGWEIA